MNAIYSLFNAMLLAAFTQSVVFGKALGTELVNHQSITAAAAKRFDMVFVAMLTGMSVLTCSAVFAVRQLLPEMSQGIFIHLFYIIIISAVYLAAMLVVFRFYPKFFQRIKPFSHLAAFNSAVFGAMFVQDLGNTAAAASDTAGSAGLISYIGYGIGAGIGFGAALWLLALARPRLNSPLVPRAFRGVPITLVFVGIISLALYTFGQ